MQKFIFSLALFLTASPILAETRDCTPFPYKVEKVTLETQPTVVKKAAVRTANLTKEIPEILGSVAEYVQRKGIVTMGEPFCRIFKYEEEGVTDLEVGFPAITAQVLGEGVETSFLPEGPGITILHKGSYGVLYPLYLTFHTWMRPRHLVPNGGAWFILNKATLEVTPKSQRTIYYPVKNG